MSSEKINLREGEKVIKQFRASWRSFWVFYFGILLCGVGPFLEENPPLSKGSGFLFVTVFVLIILRRWSNLYVLTDQRVIVKGGLLYQGISSIDYVNITNVEANQGINLRLVGAGHIFVRSAVPHEESIVIYGQPDPFGFKDYLEKLIRDESVSVTIGENSPRDED